MWQNEVVADLEKKETLMIEELSKLIAIPSISSNKKEIKRALSHILEVASNMGFECENLLNGQIGRITMGEGSETLGILTHIDVVDPGNLALWDTPPFEATLLNNRIYGRGAIDDKGALIASLFAMKSILSLQKKMNKKVQLIIGTQEEVDWTDMRAYTSSFAPPDYGFTPDGEFPICNIEKGTLSSKIKFPFNIDERVDNQLISIQAGTAKNIVPGNASAKVKAGGKIIEITQSGKSVHSCDPSQGENAIFKLTNELSLAKLSSTPLLSIMQMIESKFSDIYGAPLNLKSSSEYKDGNFVHRNTICPTLIETKNNNLFLTVNVRYPYGTNPQEIIEALESIATKYNGSICEVDDLPPVFMEKDSAFLDVLASSYEAVVPFKNEFSLAYGGSYAKAMKNIVSWGPIFPDEEDTCHQENEYINIKSFVNNAKIFALAIGEIVFSDKSFKQ